MSQAPSAPGPVTERARVHAVDAARGFALLGIFCVNILAFAEPFGTLTVQTPQGPLSDRIVHYFVAIFCMGKFYGLFSLLFGIGFALQRERVLGAGASWAGVYLRRVLFLGVLGAAHATLLWYGDILFMYACCALLLLLCGRLRPKMLVIGAVAILGAPPGGWR